MRGKVFYRWAALLLFLVEVFIAVAVPGSEYPFIRYSIGDFLVVILLYCLVKGFWEVDAVRLALGVFAFAVAVEVAQYFHLVDVLGIENQVIRIIIGTSFSVEDLFMYAAGCLTAYLLDRWWVMKL